MKTNDSFLNDGYRFLENLMMQIEARNLDLRHWSIDHLCYRTSSPQAYQSAVERFRDRGRLLIESPVNGRMISTFQLFEPFHFRGQVIDLLEVPAPKPSRPTVDGFEHAEVVCDLPLSEMMSLYPHLPWDTSGLRKDFNAELELPLDGMAVKFHLLSLKSVVTLEANARVWGAIQRSGLLADFHEFEPLIAGTFPIALDVAGSDVDVMMSGIHWERIGRMLNERLASRADFQLRSMIRDGRETVIARFREGDVPFEIFVQKDISSVRQTAYRHFQVEERFLKLGGEKFLSSLQQLRRQGLKTEPAFAQVLGLSGDPFQQLLLFDSQPEHDLGRFFDR